MIISNCDVYDLEKSLIASGYPMRTEVGMREIEEGDWRRALNLTKASYNDRAHAQWLTGVRVSFDLTFSNKVWVEAERYRFLEFVSSQSTMHRISQFDIASQCNEYVDSRIVAIVEDLKKKYLIDPSPENYCILLYNIPSGFEITARMTTNYRCLINIYAQRHNHRLPEWRKFCEELLSLPHFPEILEAYESGKLKEEKEF